MPATYNRPNTASVFFTPRQVLLGMKHSSGNNSSSNGTTLQLNQEDKLLLHISMAQYFHRCGFSKTLKKFRSEAKIEKDNVETSSVDLEEMCLKYLELCGKGAKSKINYQKELVADKHSKKDVDNLSVAGMDNGAEKKKKKKKDKSDSDPAVHQPGSDKNLEGSKNSGEKTNDSNLESEAKAKEKGTDKTKKEKKKKSKLVSESLAIGMEDDQVQSESMVIEVKDAETERKSKDKKKTKIDKLSHDGDAKELHTGDPIENSSKIDNLEASNNDVVDKKKDSKKRKRLTSEESDVQPVDKKTNEDPKRRKIDNLRESKEAEQSAKTASNLGNDSNSNNGTIGANGQVGGDQTPKTDGEQHRKTNGTNGKFSEKSSQKKQDSVEPNSAKPFQRVNIEKIKFADERLQDNSYWAKDGAETGYGAKAEEILGQVRGRGFRHEKTKKKRGSYRGGQIDLQSHSIKFNYSDDDE